MAQRIVCWRRLHRVGDPDKAVLTSLNVCATGPDPKVEIARTLARLSGRFAFVLETEEYLIAAVDRIRSVPLIWTLDVEGGLCISQTAQDLDANGVLTDRPVDHVQALAVAMSGYTIGENTVIEGVKALSAGQFLILSRRNGAPCQRYYRQYAPWHERSVKWGDARTELRDLTLDILSDLISTAKQRPIAVPLSAGLDSRLIASGLKHLGHKDVLCFSYGLKGNRESVAARDIAAALGYRQTFFEYSNARTRSWAMDRDYDRFRQYSDSLTGIHFAQDFPAIRGLRNSGFLPADAVIVNGQSGDFITGNHIPETLSDPKIVGAEEAIAPLLTKHYAQWRGLQTDMNGAAIRSLIEAQMKCIAGGEFRTGIAAGLFEAYEFANRQTKYVVNGQRCYEALGLDWEMPLWDDRYIDFWERQPLSHRLKQALYRDMLQSEDWGGVWDRIPINELIVRPPWIRPIRLAFKALHFPLGQRA